MRLRIVLAAVAFAVVGAASAVAAMGPVRGSAAYFGTMGLALVASGALALRDYLRHNQPSQGT